jgi:hypothetical protein
MNTISMRLLLLIGVRNNLKFLTADISSAYLYADTQELVYTSCGPELNFADGGIAKQGDWVTTDRALYGLSTSARQWRRTLRNTLTSIGYVATRFDQDVWMRRSKCGENYEYLGIILFPIVRHPWYRSSSQFLDAQFLIARSTGVRLNDLVSMGPTVAVVVCSSCRSLSLPYRFDFDLECRNLALEFCDESMSRFKLIGKLGIGSS